MGLREEVDGLWWYHTLELPGGVTTRGWYDLRPLAAVLPWPRSLAGMRCLDVGTANGFWAFEMERRGAAEVVALDVNDMASLDWPVRRVEYNLADDLFSRPFEIAHNALGSRVQRVGGTIYEAPDVLQGTFDFVFLGAILLHLRQPIDALTALRQVCTGTLLSVDVISLRLSMRLPRAPAAMIVGQGDPTWGTPNRLGHRQWVYAAGWELLAMSRRPRRTQFGSGAEVDTAWRDLPSRRERTIMAAKRRWGVPTNWIVARPDASLVVPPGRPDAVAVAPLPS